MPDALAEVREAVDFCRYYAARARADFGAPMALPGPTGERNELRAARARRVRLHQPVEFPAGDLHRPGRGGARRRQRGDRQARRADAADRRARRARCCTRPACPATCCTCCRATGERSARALVADPRIAGVAFTGSTETARAINRALAARDGPIVPLIAETGGQNAMIVDSSALPEQVVADALASAFDSAGQRCSALRVLFVQEDIAPTRARDAGGRDGGAADRRSGAARDRRRPGDRRRGARRRSQRTPSAWRARRQLIHALRAAGRGASTAPSSRRSAYRDRRA